jgi:hypothetical protein
MENITLIAATFRRPEIVIRLLNSIPKNINIIIINLSPDFKINYSRNNLSIIDYFQMPLTNALNIGVKNADKIYPNTKYYLLTDDDVIFNEYSIFDNFLEKELNKKDTGLIGITRIINKIKIEQKLIYSSHVYKGGGWLIRKDVFHHIGGFTDNNSADEWDICLKSYIKGYKNYRTKSCYAFHKQGTPKGGYKEAIKLNMNLGKADLYMSKYIDGEIKKISSGYETIVTKKSKFNKLANELHLKNNKILNSDSYKKY